MIELKDIIKNAMQENGFNGIIGKDCGCAIPDLFPCADSWGEGPILRCQACKVVAITYCRHEDCEWNGSLHYHRADDVNEEVNNGKD